MFLHFHGTTFNVYINKRTMNARARFITWVKRLGFFGFLFFLVKGLLWLLVPALIAILAN